MILQERGLRERVYRKRRMTADRFEQFLHLPENHGRLYELVNGEAVEKMLTEEHGTIVINIGAAIKSHIRQRGQGRVGTEAPYCLLHERFDSRQPDLSYVSEYRPAVTQGAVAHMPDLVRKRIVTFIFRNSPVYRSLLAVAIVLSLVMLGWQTAAACSCINPSSPDAARRQASVVFAGHVTNMDSTERAGMLLGLKKVTLQVSEVWKGSISSEADVWTQQTDAACGFDFQIGKSYLVYTHRPLDFEISSLCSRTGLLSNAVADLRVLGKGRSPAIESSQSLIWILVTLLLIVSGLYASVVLWRGRRRNQLQT